jgi:hypothetical protein
MSKAVAGDQERFEDGVRNGELVAFCSDIFTAAIVGAGDDPSTPA